MSKEVRIDYTKLICLYYGFIITLQQTSQQPINHLLHACLYLVRFSRYRHFYEMVNSKTKRHSRSSTDHLQTGKYVILLLNSYVLSLQSEGVMDAVSGDDEKDGLTSE